jgi:hypothetical protein
MKMLVDLVDVMRNFKGFKGWSMTNDIKNLDYGMCWECKVKSKEV